MSHGKRPWITDGRALCYAGARIQASRRPTLTTDAHSRLNAAVMMADISGSTDLYSRLGDARARQLVHAELDRLRSIVGAKRGHFIRDKGDDVLAYFTDPTDSVRATQEMLAPSEDTAVSLHLGVHFGPVDLVDGDIFGNIVNITSRLTALANGGEAWFSGTLVSQLEPLHRAAFRPLGHFPLKGVEEKIEVFSFVRGATEMHTVFAHLVEPSTLDRSASEPHGTVLHLSLVNQSVRCREGEKIHIGRSAGCGIRLEEPWVSREHAVATVRDGKAILQDTSSAGTYLELPGGQSVLLRRESMVLTGDGSISPTVKATDPMARPLAFEVL